MILIDSTVWIDWLRRRVEPQRILAPMDPGRRSGELRRRASRGAESA